MKTAKIYVLGKEAGELTELQKGAEYKFTYNEDYKGFPVSLTMPVNKKTFSYQTFPPFFDGLLPEGHQLEGLLKQAKVDRNDLFTQLLLVGHDTVGGITVEEMKHE